MTKKSDIDKKIEETQKEFEEQIKDMKVDEFWNKALGIALIFFLASGIIGWIWFIIYEFLLIVKFIVKG